MQVKEKYLHEIYGNTIGALKAQISWDNRLREIIQKMEAEMSILEYENMMLKNEKEK